MKKINKEGVDIIKKFEGLSLVPYICAGGYKTIGYGHKMSSSEKYSSITEELAEELLYIDIQRTENGISRYISSDLTDNQFSALVSFSYNLGLGALQRSTLRQKINYGASEDEIFSEFLKWVYVGGKKLFGLVKRREIEAQLYFS